MPVWRSTVVTSQGCVFMLAYAHRLGHVSREEGSQSRTIRMLTVGTGAEAIADLEPIHEGLCPMKRNGSAGVNCERWRQPERHLAKPPECISFLQTGSSSPNMRSI